jgi:hypothetical protein
MLSIDNSVARVRPLWRTTPSPVRALEVLWSLRVILFRKRNRGRYNEDCETRRGKDWWVCTGYHIEEREMCMHSKPAFEHIENCLVSCDIG